MPTDLDRIVSTLFVAAALVAGCSEGSLGERGVAGEPDAGQGVDAGDEIDGGESEDRSDAGSADADGETGVEDPGPPAVEAFLNCGAGGVSSGAGVRVMQCYGPGDLGEREASGSETRWQPGAFRVTSE